MKIILIDASHDENGKDGYEGSIPGDQIGDEVRNVFYSKVRTFWDNPEASVFRCNRNDIANAIAIRMQQTADNSHVGYSQPNRYSYQEILLKDYDPSHITEDCECDCSSLVNGIVYVTFKSVNHPETEKINRKARTVDMPSMYSKIGEFTDVTSDVVLSTGMGLQRGDILVIPDSHTAVVWEVIDDEEPPMPYKIGYATTEVYLRTAPGIFYPKCNIQVSPYYDIRNYLHQYEKVKIIGESKGWYQIVMFGEQYTWYPWVSSKYIEVAND